jgi:hemolysin III
MQLIVRPRQLMASVMAATRPRPQTREEEIANSLSHGLGLAAALVAGGFLIAAVVQRGSLSFTVGVGIYAATMVLLYLGSTLYHSAWA